MRLKIAKLNIARLLSMVMATVLLMTLLAALFVPTVFADETDGSKDDFEILPDFSFDDPIDWTAVSTQGECGENLTWSYSGGTLTIVGTGEMTEFLSSDTVPWYPIREAIRRVSLPEGLTSVGVMAFYNCNKLKTVTLPNTVTRIGAYAFYGCEALESVHLGNSLLEIGRSAFYCCVKLETIRLPDTVTRIDTQAFYRCESLAMITLPSQLQTLGTGVFTYCKNLLRVEVSARLTLLPDWTFYGCERLLIVVLPETITDVENDAFERCEELATVYYSGTDEQKEIIKNKIGQDIPVFQTTGNVTSDAPSATTMSGKLTQNDDGTLTIESTTVRQDTNMTFVSKVLHTYEAENRQNGTYATNIVIAVENKDAWAETTTAVTDTLKKLNEQHSLNNTKNEGADVTIYLKSEDTVDKSFMEEMAGRDVKVTVVSQNGSEFRVECSELKKKELSGNYNYSYTVDSASKESQDELGTDDCYKLTFEESAKINAEVVIPLPENKGNSNAFLYQVERDGSHTRLQAVAVDNDGNAHFYLGAVDKDTEYVIGVDVPNETTDDVIIPDELFPSYGSTANAIARLEKIDYVITGRQSSWGVGIAQVTWILLAVLAGCIIVVGVVMAIWNKRRLERGYVPEIEYEVEE